MAGLLSDNSRKANFSHAYVDAMAAAVGFSVERWTDDYDSIDVTIKATGRVEHSGKLSTGRSPKLDLQLKCTDAVSPKDGELHFPLSVKNYDDLSDPTRVTPALLVVLFVPKTWEQRLKWSASSLRLHKLAYWVNLRGMQVTTNKKSVTVVLREHFHPDALRHLMFLSAEGEL
ncbi:MAG: DUF4365 domain-containing protein [Nannocystaceae bacterium]|nr:DUF4365 domain-containing protein [Nannocystaceae bacterium]